MVFLAKKNELKSLKRDYVAQHYFEVLRTLISKNRLCPTSWSERGGPLSRRNLQARRCRGRDWRAIQHLCQWRIQSSRPDAKTIIFYNHYDTVPADGIKFGQRIPLLPSVRDGIMYGRGVDVMTRGISLSLRWENTCKITMIFQPISASSCKGDPPWTWTNI